MSVPTGWGAWALLGVIVLAGCGDRTRDVGVDGSVVERDGGGSGPYDAGEVPSDARAPSDGGASADAAAASERCEGGADDDADGRTDCDDDDCWSLEACAAEHVGRVVPGLVACGEPIERSAAESLESCSSLGTPTGSTYPTYCGADVTLEATLRIYCDGADAPKALWIEERLTTPELSRMLSERSFERTYYEHQAVTDWERHARGPGATEGDLAPLLEAAVRRSDSTVHRVVSVRAVEAGDSVARLLGLTRVVSVIDLDAPMSSDSRENVRSGGLEVGIPP